MTRVCRLAFYYKGAAGTIGELMDQPVPMLEAMEAELAELLKAHHGDG